MNKFNLTAIAILFVSSYFAQSTAVDYMNIFGTEVDKIQQDMWDYTSSVSHGKSARTVEKRRSELIQTSDAALKKAKSAKPFNSSAAYRDSVVTYFSLVNLVLKEDYGKIVDMEAVAEESYDAMEAYLLARERADEKLSEAAEMVSREQKRFASENSVKLVETSDEISKKMEIADQVYEHYNTVYLIFFKSYKQEAYLMNAIERKDLAAIEQNRNALISTTEEGLAKLKTLSGYKNDNSLIEAAKKMLDFYNDEAKNSIPKMADYLLAAENFDKAKKAMESKKEKERTKEDVEKYNQAVNDINKNGGVYNSVNSTLNTNRSRLLENWNNTAAKYTDKYVPKG